MIKYANVQNATKLKAPIEVSVTVIKIKYGIYTNTRSLF